MISRYRDGAGARRRQTGLDEDFDEPRTGRRAARQRRADAGAGGDLGPRAAAEPFRRGARAVEARQGRGAAGELDVVLSSLAEGLRVITVLLHPWLPATSEKLLAALGTPIRRSRRRSSARAASEPSSRSSRSSPSSRPSPPPRDRQPHPPGLLRARERRARSPPRAPPGSAGSSRWAWTPSPAGRRRWRPSASPRSTSQSAATRTSPRVRRPRDRPAALVRRARALPRDRRDRARPLPRPRAAGRPAAGFEAQIELAASSQAARHPLARGRGRQLATLRERADGVRVILHCFSMPDRLDECLEQPLW